MRKLPAILIVALLFCYFAALFTTRVFAANKVGVNIAARHNEFEQAAELVGSGGFIVIMASPGNADEIAPLLNSHPDKNIILRGHCPSDPLGPDLEKNKNMALSWMATLGSLETAGRKIYFMPWNEPNMTRECGGAGNDFDPNNVDCAPYVKQYILDLRSFLNLAEAGNVGGSVLLLSPMINQHHANFDAFVNYLGKDFFDQFAGIAMNLYDNQTCGGPLCHPDPHRNAGKFEEILNMMSSSKEAFAVETGIVDVSGTCPPGVTDCPVYKDSQMKPFIETAWVNSWSKSGRLRMFSPLSYNPEINPPSWIWGGETASYMKSIRGGGLVKPVAGFDKTRFLAWREEQLRLGNLIKCPGRENAYAVSKEYCGFCAGGGYGKEEIVPFTETRADTYTKKVNWGYEHQPTPTPAPGGSATKQEAVSAQGFFGDKKEIKVKISMEGIQAKFPFLKSYEKMLTQALKSILPASIRPARQTLQFKSQTFAPVCEKSSSDVKVSTAGQIKRELPIEYTNYLYETDPLGAAIVPGKNETTKRQLMPPPEIPEEIGNAPVGNCEVEQGKETLAEERKAPGTIKVQSQGLVEKITKWLGEILEKVIRGIFGHWSSSYKATIVLRNFTPGLKGLFKNTISSNQGFWNAYRPNQLPKLHRLASSNPDEVLIESSPGKIVEKKMKDKYLAGVMEAQKKFTCGYFPFALQKYCDQFFEGEPPVVDPVTGEIDVTPPTSTLLQDLFREAADKWDVPLGVIAAVAKIEGGHMWGYSDIKVDKYSQPGGEDPKNCTPNVCSAAGPMQMTTGKDKDGNSACPACPPAKGSCPNQWASFGDSVLEVDSSRIPNVCNIKDALHAAAHKMKNDSGGRGWNKETVYQVAERYYGKCDDEHRYSFLGNRTYCEFVWEYYQNYKQ